MYLDHRTVDSKCNIIVDCYITRGNVHDSVPYISRLEYLKRKFGFDIKEVGIDSGYDTLDIKKYLHDNNIIHRDLKSANLFLMKNGLVKIGDLNVSKIAKLGMAYTQIGTPYYASPEIWKDTPYDSKTDIWSIGCIVYEMCALKPPFRGTSLINLAENIVTLKDDITIPLSRKYRGELKLIKQKMKHDILLAVPSR